MPNRRCADHPTLINAIGDEKMKNLVLENRQDALIQRMSEMTDRQEAIFKAFQDEMTRLYDRMKETLDEFRADPMKARTGEIN